MLLIQRLLVTGLLSLAPGLHAQIISEALASFPSRTELVEYDNLSALRTLPDYNTLSQRFAGQPLEQARSALAKLNISADQVDELVIGTSPDAIYGIVLGTFNGASATKFAEKHHLLPLPVEDNQIYCPGTGTCITFLQDDLAAFGNPTELKTILQTRLGIYDPLRTNQALVTLMNNTQPRALVRGFALGRQIRAVVQSSLPEPSLFHLDWSAVASTISMFSYSIEFDTIAHVTAELRYASPTSAFLLKQMLSALAVTHTFDNMQVSSQETTISVKLDTPSVDQR